MNTCTLCLQEKPLSAFESNSRMRKGILNQCRECKYKRRVSDPEQRAKKNASVRRWKIKSLYGITEEQYWEMHTMQMGRCAICNKVDANGKALAVDHDHVTGKARKLLCSHCNLMIGHADENPEILKAGIKYLLDMQKKGLSRPKEVTF